MTIPATRRNDETNCMPVIGNALAAGETVKGIEKLHANFDA